MTRVTDKVTHGQNTRGKRLRIARLLFEREISVRVRTHRFYPRSSRVCLRTFRSIRRRAFLSLRGLSLLPLRLSSRFRHANTFEIANASPIRIVEVKQEEPPYRTWRNARRRDDVLIVRDNTVKLVARMRRI